MEKELWLHRGKKLQRSGPDGLEAWGIAAAAFCINLIMAGINRTSGILYVAFIEVFQIDRREASLPFTIRSLSRNLLGPVVGILGQKYGVRPIILVGGVIATLSTMACFFANDIIMISVFWGCISGLGAAMVMTLTQVAIGEHFVKHKSTASGIGFSGGCIGSFVFPFLFEKLIERYSVQGTFLFIAAIIMHVIPAAIILRKPTWLNYRQKKERSALINRSINAFVSEGEVVNTIIEKEQNSVNDTYILRENEEMPNQRGNINANNDTSSQNNSSVNENMNVLINEIEAVDTVICKSKNDIFNIDVVKKSDETMNDNPNRNNNLSNGSISSVKKTKDIDTDFMLKNKELLIYLLTNDFTLELPSASIWKDENFSDDPQITEVLDIFCKILKDCYEDSRKIKCSVSFNISAPKCSSENKSEDKEMLYVNGYSNIHITEATPFISNQIDYLLFLLEKFFERDKEDIIQLFPEDKHDDVYKMCDELKESYLLLQSSRCNTHKSNNLCKDQTFVKSTSYLRSNAEPSNTFYSHIKTALWLHAKPLFLLICLCRCTHFMTFMPILTTVVDFSRDKGLPEGYGKYSIGTLAFGDLFGRLLTGWITDKKYLTLPRYMFTFLVLTGIFTIAIAPTNSTASLLTVLTIYGLLQGCTFIQHPVLVSHYMGKDEQSIALGCLNFFPGILAFAMPSYIGYFRDIVGSYNGMFYINGSVAICIGFLWLAEPYFLKCSLQLPQRRQQIPV